MPTIHSFHLSDPGQKRANNEDSVGAFEPKDARQLRRSGRLYIVADGLGGHQMGEQASQLVVDSLIKFYYEAPEIPPEKRLQDIIQQVHQKLVAARRNMASGDKMATTVVAAVVRNDTLQVAHVGDSRAYLLRDGKLHQVTRDHSFIGEMMRAGAVTEDEAMQSPYRNRLTRSVGGSDGALEVDVTAPIPLRPGDLILLCTDGLTQYANSQDLLAAASYGTPQQIVERLIHFANARGGSDNITVSVVQYGKTPTPRASLPSWKTLAAVGAGTLMLVMLAFLGWYALIKRPASLAPTATPTVTSMFTLTAPPSPTLTLTLEPTLITTIPPTETPLTIAIPPNPTETIVDCKYTVQSGDSAWGIALLFGVKPERVFREDRSQENMGDLKIGDILIINDTNGQACINAGGESLPPTVIP